MSAPLANHQLIGTWITESEDSDTAFVISAAADSLQVSGFCRSSGEPFEISDVAWDGAALRFTARFPPTDTVTKNVLRARSEGVADLEVTIRETWVKREAKPGELPEAWRAERRRGE